MAGGELPHDPPVGRRASSRWGVGRAPPEDPRRFWSARLRLQAALVGAVAAPALLLAAGSGGIVGYLPVAAADLGLSFVRMLLAYLLSLVFALTYGYFAATSRTGERLLIPILDILQSVPILGFFPVAIGVFIAATGPESPVGPNLAAIFLIFTSMSWNMAFGVYESLKSVPAELREATDSFGARGWQRLSEVLAPATVNRLVYNSVLSWTAGWYFLVAAEFIATAKSTTALPGIGTFLLTHAAAPGDASALVAGLFVLVVAIALLDLAVWRPLARWAEKFRYDQVPSGAAELTGTGRSRIAPLRRAAGYVVRGMRTGVTRLGSPFVGLATLPALGRSGRAPTARPVARYLALGALLVVVWLFLITVTVAAFRVFTGPIVPLVRHQILELPAALGLSFGRVVLAYLLCVAVSVPLALYLYRRPGVARVGLPVVEVVASVPATALFPLFLFALLARIGPEGTSVLMLVTGMVWYLFFNVLSGLRGIPPDLAEAARSFGLPRREYYRRLVLPAIVPAFITGSITAFGGGWNTLIIAENLGYGGGPGLQVLGVGGLLDVGNLEPGGAPLMAAALLSLVVAVVAVNELLWKPLYRRAVERFRID